MRKSTTGFTIVELLIVIVVIAILAAISIVAYTGIQDRALDSTIKADLANFAKKIELAKVDTSDGFYPTTITPAMGIAASKSAYRVNANNWYYCVSPDRSGYALGVVDKQSGYYFQSTYGGIEKVGSLAGASTCIKAGNTGGSYQAGYIWNSTTSTGAWNSWVN